MTSHQPPREYILAEGEEATLAGEEEIVVVAMRDIITPRLSAQHATLLQHLLVKHYPSVNFNRSLEEDMTMTESRLLVALQSTSDLNAVEKSETGNWSFTKLLSCVKV